MHQKGFVKIILIVGIVVILGVVGFLVLSRQTLTPTPESSPSPEPSPTSTIEPGGIVKVVGTVKFIDLEGGFWGIVGNDGNKYNPKNLPKELQKEGLSAEFTLKTAEDQVGIRMWGTVVEIQATKPQLFDKDLRTLPTAKPWQPGDPVIVIPEGLMP